MRRGFSDFPWSLLDGWMDGTFVMPVVFFPIGGNTDLEGFADMWSIFGFEGYLYGFVCWGGEPEALVCEDFGLVDECWVLHDIVI